MYTKHLNVKQGTYLPHNPASPGYIKVMDFFMLHKHNMHNLVLKGF